MRFINITLIVHAPHPVTGAQASTADQFREVLDSALLAEELGFDGFGVGERHERPFISPAQVIEKVHRYHEQFGHTVLHLHADAGGLPAAARRRSLELFQSDIAPVLRREIPDPPWGWGGGPLGDDAVPAATAPHTSGATASDPAAVSPVATTG